MLESFLCLDAQTTVISALKTTKNGNGIIIRLAESGGHHDTANITSKSSGFNFTFELMPYQVLTVKLSQGNNDWEMNIVDALEKQLI